MKLYSPPELAQGLAELRVMKTGVLVTQPPPRCLGPHHERVHWPLHVDPLLVQPEIQLEMYDKHCYVGHSNNYLLARGARVQSYPFSNLST